MTDTLGVLELPAPVPVVYPVDERTPAPGDPALELVASFVATALQAELGAAWAALSAEKPDIPDAINNDRDGTGAVRRVLFSDPRDGYFEPADLPALFVWRSTYQPYVRVAADAYRRRTTITIAWMPPRADEDPQRRERDPFVNAVSAALHKVLLERRHPAWVAPGDVADPDGLKTSFATSTSAATISSFNGALAGATMVGSRPITITKSAAAGAYNPNDPITVTGLLENGVSFSERVFFTDDSTEETVGTLFPFASPTTIAFPDQPTTGGTLTIGYGASPDARKGSLVQRLASFCEWRHGKSGIATVQVKRADGEAVPFRMFEIALDVGEDFAADPDLRSFDPYDIHVDGVRGDLGEEVFEFDLEG